MTDRFGSDIPPPLTTAVCSVLFVPGASQGTNSPMTDVALPIWVAKSQRLRTGSGTLFCETFGGVRDGETTVDRQWIAGGAWTGLR